MNTNQLLSEFQFFDKYSRFNHEKGRRETWEESVRRSVDYLRELSGDKLPENDYQKIKEYMLEKKAFPSMRLFAMAGEAARRDNASIYNCAAIDIDSIDALVEVMALSMAGCGVGFGIENRIISSLPTVEHGWGKILKETCIIDDSTEGWLGAFKRGLETWFDGNDVEFDYSKVRPAGSILKIKGGRASGPTPLKELLDFTRTTILGAKGRRLKSIEVHDIVTKIADCVVSGGVRRSALISLFDYDDEDMRHAKDYGWWKTAPQRANANNSVIIDKELSREEIQNLFMTMHNSGGGEPGFMFRVNVNRMNPERRADRDDWKYNPCFAPGTMVHTKSGHRKIESLVGESVEVWDGNEWIAVDNFRVTGENQDIYRVVLYDGSAIEATANHRFILSDGRSVEAAFLEAGDRLKITSAPKTHGSIQINGAYLKGFLVGDGTKHDGRALLWLYETKYGCADRLITSAMELDQVAAKTSARKDVGFIKAGKNRRRMTGLAIKEPLFLWVTEYKKYIPDELFDAAVESKAEFIAGVMDADGCAFDTRNGFSYQISSIHRKWLEDFQLLLKTIGVNSKLTLSKKAGKKDFNDGRGFYESKDCYRLTISQSNSIALSKIVSFSRLVSFKDKVLKNTPVNKFNKVVSVAKVRNEPLVYCCTVKTTHQFALTAGIDIGQCGEVNLRGDGQLCNLSQAIVRPDDTLETLKEKVRVATIIGTIQSAATHFPYLRDIWKRNVEEERLLGVDLAGQLDAPHLITPENLDVLKQVAIETNEEYATLLDIPQSAAVTCNKPSGNSSILFDCAPGLHSRWSDYYIRRFRINAGSPIRYILEAAGMTLYPENGQKRETATTFVVEFPSKSPDGAVTNGTRNAIQQCEWWKMNKLYWTEHNPSVTILYKTDEIDGIIQWLFDNQSIIGGMSFLPRDDHYYPLAPYEKITKGQYEELIKSVPVIDWEAMLRIYEGEDNTTVAQELGCMSGACEI